MLIRILIVVAFLLGACAEFDPLLLRYENLPTCDFREPITVRCREVRGQWGGQHDGVVHQP